jgi:hypothetical protein
MAEIVVTQSDATRAWRPREMITRTPGADGTTDELVVRVIGSGTARVEVRWGLDATLVKSDDGDVDDLLKALEELMGVAASAGALAAAGTPTPQQALDLSKKTITGFDHLAQVFSSEKTTVQLGAIRMPVKYQNRRGEELSVRGTILLDAHWMTDEPDDTPWESTIGDGNFAWFETENFSLRTGHQCAASGSLDIKQPWKPASTTVEAHRAKPLVDQAVSGRAFLLPQSNTDRLGFFPQYLTACSTTVNQDEAEVTFDLSMNALADDLLLVVCRSVTLILELFEPKKPPRRQPPGRQKKARGKRQDG